MICAGDLALALTCLAVVLGFFARGFYRMSQATDRLTASVTALSSSVDALIAKAPPDDSPVVNAAADAVDLLKAKVDAAVAAVPGAPVPA